MQVTFKVIAAFVTIAIIVCFSSTAFAQCLMTNIGPLILTPVGWRPCNPAFVASPVFPPPLPPAYAQLPLVYRAPGATTLPPSASDDGTPAPGVFLGIVRDQATGALRGVFRDAASGALVEAGVPAPVAGWIAGRWNANLDTIGQEHNLIDKSVKLLVGVSPAAIRKNGWCGGANSEARKWLGWTKTC